MVGHKEVLNETLHYYALVVDIIACTVIAWFFISKLTDLPRNSLRWIAVVWNVMVSRDFVCKRSF